MQDNTQANVLVVDDDEDSRFVVRYHLEQQGWNVTEAATGASALEQLDDSISFIVLDLHLPDAYGIDLLKKVRNLNATVPVAILTAHKSVPEVVRAIKLGAVDFLLKPFESQTLTKLIEKSLSSSSGPTIVGKSQAIQNVHKEIVLVANSSISVLVQGATGTGKELIARAIHEKGARAAGPFIALNCAAIPENLFESELFGYEKGAFTGAQEQKKGQFELAQSGTLFMDEISEMPLSLQAKLLRVLETRTVRRIGGQEDIHLDVRFVAATNKNLLQKANLGAFREDLFYRLQAYTITIPPLSERPEDILLLAEHFSRLCSQQESKPFLAFDADARRALEDYDWPGNIRELKNVVDRSVLVANDSKIRLSDLPPRLQGCNAYETQNPETLEKQREQTERIIIEQAIERCGGNISKACRELGIARATLYRKLSKQRN